MGLNPHAQPLGQKSEKAPAKRGPAKKPAAGKALAVVKDDKLDTDLTKAKAVALTKKIATGLEATMELLHQALTGRVWLALGHKSWDDYIKAEFPTAPLALPMEKRKPTVASLAERGWSTRAIAAATGASKSAIQRDVSEELSQNGAVTDPQLPTGDDAPKDGEPEVIDAEVVSEEPADRVVTGLDGKERTVTVKPVSERKGPVVINVVAEARGIVKDLAALTTRLGTLHDREEYEENKAAVDETLQTAINDFVEEASAHIEELSPEPEPAL